MEATGASGRFGSDLVCSRLEFDIFDNVIERYGAPAFVRTGVEGFELKVPRALSLEFSGKHIQSTLDCIDRLESLGPQGTRS